MMKLIFVAVCFLCLCLPSTSFVETAIPLILQAAPVIAAKIGVGAATAATVGTTVTATTAAVAATTTAATATTTTVAVTNAISLFISAHPVSAGVAIGVVSVGISVSAYMSSQGESYFYNGTDPKFRAKLQAGKRITWIGKYGSPIGGKNQSTFHHHEIIFAIDNLIWGIVSFSKEGLETGIAFEKENLTDRRNKNTPIESKKLSVPAQKLQSFLLKNEGYKYHLLLWNCRSFSNALWGALDESYNYTATDPQFLQKIMNASRITHIEKYGSPTKSDTIEHHEVIVQIDDQHWGLISFEDYNIETKIASKKTHLIARRPKNKLIKGKKIQASAERLRGFFQKLKDTDEDNLFIWNSQQFAQALWDEIVQS